MPRVTEDHRQAMRQRIHQATLRAFLRNGVQATSMAEIISESGLSAGALYGYYKSKDELVAAVAGEIVSERITVGEAMLTERPLPPPQAIVRALVTTLPDYYFESGLVVEIWSMGSRDQRIFDHLQLSIEGIFTAIRHYLTAYARENDVPVEPADSWAIRTAPVLMGLAQGYIVQRTMLGGAMGQRYLDGLDELRIALPADS